MTDDTRPGASDLPPREPGEPEDDRFAVRISVNRDQARRLTARTDLDFGDRPHLRPQSGDRAILEAFATTAQIDGLRGEGYQVEVGQNVSAAGRERQAELSQGDRFEGGRIAPRGIGRKEGGRRAGGSGPRAAS